MVSPMTATLAGHGIDDGYDVFCAVAAVAALVVGSEAGCLWSIRHALPSRSRLSEENVVSPGAKRGGHMELSGFSCSCFALDHGIRAQRLCSLFGRRVEKAALTSSTEVTASRRSCSLR